MITPREIIKAKATSYCFRSHLHRTLQVGESFDAKSDWVGC
jgi:hypothetical protein